MNVRMYVGVRYEDADTNQMKKKEMMHRSRLPKEESEWTKE